MTKVFKLRVVKGKYTAEQFKALLGLLNKIIEEIGDSVTGITVAKHQSNPIFIYRFYVNDIDLEKIKEVMKQIDLMIVDITHKYFDGKRNIFSFVMTEESAPRNGNSEEAQVRTINE